MNQSNPKKPNKKPLFDRFAEQFRNNRTTRVLCVTLLVLLVIMTVVVTVTVAANRAKKPPKESESESIQTINPGKESESSKGPQESESDTPKPSTGNETESEPPKQVIDEIPTFTLPVKGVLSASHNAELQVYSNTMKDYRVHLGVDVSTEAGAPVYAAADGTVAKIWQDPLMGTCMAIQHAGDCLTVYKNLAVDFPAGIKEGGSVQSGQLIGSVGDTAMVESAEEPHLHFEMTVAGLAVDPLAYFDEATLATLKMDTTYD